MGLLTLCLRVPGAVTVPPQIFAIKIRAVLLWVGVSLSTTSMTRTSVVIATKLLKKWNGMVSIVKCVLYAGTWNSSKIQ